MMWWYGGGMPGWGQVIMLIGTVLFWVAIVGIAVAAVRLPRRDRRGDPEELLAERFARGEIDEPEYRARLDVLVGAAAVPRRAGEHAMSTPAARHR
jgi:putative membrane protein